jgi:hypothetical protein
MHRVIDNFYHTEWTVPAEEINTLIETVKAATNASNIDSLPRKRGPKGYDTWELFKARLYISLDYDDVPHNGDINIEQRSRDDEHLTGGMRMPCAACSRCDGN